MRYLTVVHHNYADLHPSAYLENLCDYLYDDLRPRILHEPKLHVLGEVCTVLQALMVLDDQQGEEDEEDALGLSKTATNPLSPTHDPRARRGIGPLHISHFLRMILQDAQTRLFFKAQTLVQSEIRYFVPKGNDLAYPDKLTGTC